MYYLYALAKLQTKLTLHETWTGRLLSSQSEPFPIHCLRFSRLNIKSIWYCWPGTGTAGVSPTTGLPSASTGPADSWLLRPSYTSLPAEFRAKLHRIVCLSDSELGRSEWRYGNGISCFFSAAALSIGYLSRLALFQSKMLHFILRSVYFCFRNDVALTWRLTWFGPHFTV